MRISVAVDSSELVRLADRFPKATAEAISIFTERTGYKIEREAKVEAPAITGNLRRQIRFIKSSPIAGVVKAFANYSGYVHGAPFHHNFRRRKETPFLTMALGNSQTFIDAERSKIIRNISKRV